MTEYVTIPADVAKEAAVWHRTQAASVPTFDDAELCSLLPWACADCRSFEEVRRADWLGLLQSRLTQVQAQAVEREAPERMQVPSGSRIALVYESGRAPLLAVRIQEMFGLKETPRIAGGRVRVLLHLLAPNYRPQQVTDDLASFWKNTYPLIRKELRIRYPKHAWPEDPTTAVARRASRQHANSGAVAPASPTSSVLLCTILLKIRFGSFVQS